MNVYKCRPTTIPPPCTMTRSLRRRLFQSPPCTTTGKLRRRPCLSRRSTITLGMLLLILRQRTLLPAERLETVPYSRITQPIKVHLNSYNILWKYIYIPFCKVCVHIHPYLNFINIFLWIHLNKYYLNQEHR